MSLEALGLLGLERRGPVPAEGLAVTGITVDSRMTGEGDLFFALPGTVVDGATFGQYAVRKGAVAVVASAAGAAQIEADLGSLPVPVFLSARPRVVLAQAASIFWPGQPGVMAAVTGTNGKTSVASFTRQIWAHAGLRAACFGTTGVEGGGPDLADAIAHTTPEPIALHKLLSRLAEAGITHAAMEASSHGLAQHRVDGVRFAIGALTNIQRDHLDYHASHEDYVAAKLRLFSQVLPEGAAAVIAEPALVEPVREIAERRGLRLVVVGGAGADLAIERAEPTSEGIAVRLSSEGGGYAGTLPLLGAFQASNVAVAAAMALGSGLRAADVFDALPRLRGVRGRMQRVARRVNGAQVVVDYAHTPDAIVAALAALRPHTEGRLIVISGAGGDRDPGKRPLMGRAMAEGADHAIVTDDNPRSEDPAAIRAAVMQGCPEAEEIGDRAEAILAGVDMARDPGDILLIAGKGHEQGQEVAGRVIPFDDAAQARAAVGVLDAEGDA